MENGRWKILITMSKRTLFLIFALFLITLVLLVMAIYQPQAPKTIQTAVPTKEPVAQTTLSFGNPVIATSSSAIILNYSLPINISTGKNKVTTVQLELQYDPLILTDVAAVPGTFFAKPNIILPLKIDKKTGRMSYVLGVGITDQSVTGKGVVANITFSVKAGTFEKTAIIFLPKTLVTAEGVSESVLKPTINGIFTVGEKPSTSSAK